MKIFIDPPSEHYYHDRLFDEADTILNRDGTLKPFSRLLQHFNRVGIEMHTADYLLKDRSEGGDYYSFGVLDNYEALRTDSDIRLQAFVIFEPPVVAPRLYRALPEITSIFQRVYIHNTSGDGYSLNKVDRRRLHKLYWPLPYRNVMDPFWNKIDRMCKIIVINGNHNPRFRSRELYSTRIEAMVSLAKLGVIDLYGRGWDQWWSPKSMWLPYWQNRTTLMSIYRGSCKSKFEVLSQYKFCLCFENMDMDGYITEKIFDCLYAGTIPLYLGAKDVADYVPNNVYIDCRRFVSWKDMWAFVKGMPDSSIQEMREAGRSFFNSEKGSLYYNSLYEILEISDKS